ncbi:MAG: hypothetical protein DI548_02845 [Flavobacterium johnsoniae]|nr:MAG: hypothetical protein DI548_02845 [Flavobacterium johnsoniae]
MKCSYCNQKGGEDAHLAVSCPKKSRGGY